MRETTYVSTYLGRTLSYVIVWIDFLLKSLHYSISPKKLLKFCMKCVGEEDRMEAVKSLYESVQVFFKYLIFLMWLISNFHAME